MYKPDDDYLKFEGDYEEEYSPRPRSKRNTILAIVAFLIVAGIWAYFSQVAVSTAVTDSSSNSTEGTTLDIHILLDSNAEDKALSLSSAISLGCSGNQIDFSDNSAIPHITLYQTAFLTSAVTNGTLAGRLSSLLADWAACEAIELDVTYASGSYGLWNVTNIPSCLQELSDSVVQATYDLAVPNQPVPQWVYGLDDPTEVAEKEQMVALYGSPNVYSQFNPHVTLAWDDSDTDDFPDCMTALGDTDIAFDATVIGLGEVGNYGTVVSELQVFELVAFEGDK